VIEHVRSFELRPSGRRTQVGERFDVRHLARLPLGLSYPAIVREVAMVAARPPIGGRCEVVIDDTGVGRPVGDLFETAGLKPTRVTITAGGEQTWTGKGWNVAKTILISTLDARLHTGELRFAKDLLEATIETSRLGVR
jgi:hypothetical protein